MSFYQKINQLILQCRQYQDYVDKNELWFSEPYQSKYLAINKMLQFYEEHQLEIEALSAGEQSAPGMPSLTPARSEYYQLKKVIPPFLASGSKSYYYLQIYKIACMHLLKTFSYSTFKGDWNKVHELSAWMVAIRGQQEQHNAESSLQKSIKDIKELGSFEHLDAKGLKQLEEEILNIQTLLKQEPNLQDKLSVDDLQLYKDAVDYVELNKAVLEALPTINDFTFEEPSVIEVIAYLCRQLTVLIDYFPDAYPYETEVVELDKFKQVLNDHFDLSIGICYDIYDRLITALGSYQNPRISTFCQMLHKALAPFTEEQFLLNQYGQHIYADAVDIERGIPSTIDLEYYLMIAVGDKKGLASIQI